MHYFLLYDIPSDGENWGTFRSLLHPFFHCVDQRVTLFHDFVLYIEDALSLTTLPFFEALYLFLDLVLLQNGRCLPSLTIERFDLFLGIAQLLFSG
jgi:hypothetical protein